ncbi:MAG: PAS domain-containing protein [Bacteroidota bacterium]
MELSENKDLFQTVFDTASNGIAVLQSIYNDKGRIEDFSILLFNKPTLHWIGDQEYKNKRCTEMFPMVKTTDILERLIEVAETGVNTNFDRWYDGEGMHHWFHFTAVKQGELLVVTAHDITKSKQTAIALNESLYKAEKQKRLYDSITNNTPDLVYVFDLDYNFTYANKALLTMWGKSATEAIGRGLRENGYEEWHAQMHEREIDKIIATKKSIRGTVSFPHAELGRRIYDYILVPVMNEKNEVEAIAGTTRDITDLKKAEEGLKESENRFRNMIEQAPVAIGLTRGKDFIFESINPPMLEIINKKHKDDVIGKPLNEVLPELERQAVWGILENVLQSKESFHGNEVAADLLKDGVMESRYFNISYTHISDPDGTSYVLHMAIDVTEQVVARKKLEESEGQYRKLSETLEQQVSERTKELKRSNEDLQQFAHVASHDLKEPVRKIKTFTSRLEEHLDGKLDEPAKRFIERVHVAADRMFIMIDGVLAYSKINADFQKPVLVDLNEVLKSIEIDLEVALQKTDGKIQYHGLPTLEGAQVLLYQLFYNLINNSIKFARENIPPKITISSETLVESDKSFAFITVKDNGIGFDPNHAKHIFETFTRLNPKDKYEGTGLGLALCKKIIERHDGSITATGKPNEGAIFSIKLPLKQKEISI